MPRRVFQAFAAVLGLLFFSISATAQESQRYSITGVVQQPGGAPLAGAQVLIRGTRQGTITDAQGRYTIPAALAQGRYTIEYSFIGRATVTRDVTLATAREVTVPAVTLQESALELEELVVTGPGAASERRALGNAVASVTGEEINRAPATSSVGVALQGKVTGALISVANGQPGGPITIRLRGNNSILGTAEPIVVVDGVIIDNTTDALIGLSTNATRGGAGMSSRLSDFSPDDVERIEVLKGASAAALYGSRAKNGVIQIFTKRGTSGAARVSWSTEFEVSETPNRLELNMAPTATAADVAIAAGAGVTRPDGTPLRIGDPVTRIDQQDFLFRTGTGATSQLSVSGGNASTQYYLSGAYRNEESIMRGAGATRYTVRGKLTQMIGEKLELTGNGSFVKSHVNFVPEGEQGNGVLTSVVFTPTIFNPAFNGNLGRYPYNPVLSINPLDVIENWDAPEDVTRFVGNVDANYRLFENLNVRYLFGIDDYRQESRFLRPRLSEGPNFTGSIQNPIRLSTSTNHDLTANLESQVSESIKLTTLGGFRYTTQVTDIVRAAADNITPGQELVAGATPSASQSLSELRTSSFFGQLQGALGDRLYLTAGANYEASSAFGENERWQLFPRLGISWVVNNEPFFENSMPGFISSLRLRAGYGETGGQPPSLYDRFANYINTSYAGQPGLIASTIADNPNLKPERQSEIEAGFELGVLEDRAVLEFTGYFQKTKDLVLGVPQPLTSGFTTRRENVGEVENKGVEIALNTINFSNDKLTWRSRLTFAANRNEVTKVVASSRTRAGVPIPDTLIVGYLNAVIQGQPVGVFYGGQYDRDENGDIVYCNVNNANFPGQPLRLPERKRLTRCAASTFVNTIIGDPNPDWTGSFSNTFSIGRNVEINMLFDGRFGNDVANFTRRITEFFGSDKVLELEASGDTVPMTFGRNPNGRINIYEEYIEDGSFIKLRELSASYTINAPFVRRLGAQNMRISLSGRNLLTFTDYRGLDPELNLFSANTVAQGVDFSNTPLARTFVFGVNFGF
jgi:TonB-dependent starch-binding outer membrane protein SusC